jgi:hypothetical protein
MVATEGVGDYVGDGSGEFTQTGVKLEVQDTFQNPHPAYEFLWGISDVVSALLDAGLRLKIFREYAHINGWSPFPNMRELPGRRSS